MSGVFTAWRASVSAPPCSPPNVLIGSHREEGAHAGMLEGMLRAEGWVLGLLDSACMTAVPECEREKRRTLFANGWKRSLRKGLKIPTTISKSYPEDSEPGFHELSGPRLTLLSLMSWTFLEPVE
eukprot:1156595-Pelagomonas_calceolata.AAC.4